MNEQNNHSTQKEMKKLRKNNIEISMTSKYDPYENAKAERVNGTIKNEFELDKPLPGIKYATREITNTVKIYNQLRLHLRCRMHTPDQMHQHINPNPKKLKTNMLWEKLFLDNFN